jgi:hypothetical protein
VPQRLVSSRQRRGEIRELRVVAVPADGERRRERRGCVGERERYAEDRSRARRGS